MQTLNLLPAELGIDDADMQASINTEYPGSIIDLSMAYRILVRIKHTSTGGSESTGLSQLLWQETDESGAAYGAQLNLMTAINTKVDGQVATFCWGGGLAVSVINGTVGANIDKFLHIFRTGYLILEVTEVNDAVTSASADVEIAAQLFD